MDSRRVLIVEDDEGLRHLIQKTLGTRGFEVNAAAAGSELVTRLWDSGLTVPVIVMTSQGDEQLAARVREALG